MLTSSSTHADRGYPAAIFTDDLGPSKFGGSIPFALIPDEGKALKGHVMPLG